MSNKIKIDNAPCDMILEEMETNLLLAIDKKNYLFLNGGSVQLFILIIIK
jgi:hypothetical protein